MGAMFWNIFVISVFPASCCFLSPYWAPPHDDLFSAPWELLPSITQTLLVEAGATLDPGELSGVFLGFLALGKQKLAESSSPLATLACAPGMPAAFGFNLFINTGDQMVTARGDGQHLG